MQNNVTTAEDNREQVATDRALKTYILVATFSRNSVVKAVNHSAALRQAEDDGLTLSNDGSMNLLNWNAYEADSATPDLLAAARVALSVLEVVMGNDVVAVRQQLRAAIAKATT